MKIIFRLVIIPVVFVFHYSNAQEFKFDMIFTDAVGNSDSLVLGYDPNATDSVDSEFGEVNIINTGRDSVFDVRITDEWTARVWNSQESGSYHLKKQIVKANCDTWTTPANIDIKCRHWPVTARWNSQLFDDICREGSVFTSMTPGSWWDVSSPSNLNYAAMSYYEEVTFSSNVREDKFSLGYAYIDQYQDTISVFWVAMGDTLIFGHGVGVDEKKLGDRIVLYPNPASDYLTIEIPEFISIASVRVIDLSGRKQVVELNDRVLDVHYLKRGMYFLSLTFENTREVVNRKIVKE